MAENREVCITSFQLNNGMKLPAVGLGTWQGTSSEKSKAELRDSIIHALQNGYRVIDTAQYYHVEPVVGQAVRQSGIPRSEITVITKFWSDWHHNPSKALQRSLDALGLDYVDIFLMHWPCAETPDGQPLGINDSPTFVETWKMMEKCLGEKCKAIGVSNFTQKTLDVLLSEATIVPAVNQVELHPFNPNLKLVPYCQERGICVMSWSTMGGGGEWAKNEIVTHPLFKRIAASHQCSTGVVSLSWAVQRGICVIPKSSSFHRIEENIKLVTLTPEEMKEINEAHIAIRKLRLGENIQGLWKQVNGKKTILGWSVQDFGWEDAEGNWLT